MPIMINYNLISRFKIALFVCNLISCCWLNAQNPISPEGIFLADPSAHVWQDGSVYLYGSVDKKPDDFCSEEYHVLSSENMLKWTLHRSTFAAAGKNDEVLYNNNNTLYAPDCYFKNGKYYLYYCQPGSDAEGVAVGNSPIGPFKGGEKMNTYRFNEIDPSVFVDDDGKAYYTWGQMNMKIARLKPSMKEIDSNTIVKDIITEKSHYFHEGSFMTKRNGIYYIVYAHMGRQDKPTCLGYATSKSPFGPYTYGGVIIDNAGCDPSNWNNHGSIAEVKGKWYVFYHRTTNGSISMRKACVEPISFNNDGSINEVEMTSQGAGKPLNAFDTIEGRTACLLNGKCIIKLNENKRENVANIYPNDYVVYKYIDFGTGADSIAIKVKLSANEGGFNIQIDKPWGNWMGYVHFPESKSDNKWQIVKAKISPLKGVHALYFKFYGKNEKDSGFEIESFVFKKSK